MQPGARDPCALAACDPLPGARQSGVEGEARGRSPRETEKATEGNREGERGEKEGGSWGREREMGGCEDEGCEDAAGKWKQQNLVP